MIIAVSACLLGRNCRYDGASKPNEKVIALQKEHTLIPICPEVMGGLSIPHPANEIQTDKSTLSVVDAQGMNNTEAFVTGAKKTLERIKKSHADAVILKAKSPSCGVGQVYDGSFTGTLTEGNGVTAQMIINANIPVATEKDFQKIIEDI